jgi:hypothetical protein
MEPTIDRLSTVMEVLRRQIAESAQRLDTKGGKAPAPTTSGNAPAKPPLQDVKRRIRERLVTISPQDPDRAKKAQRLFIESVLAWEFGDALLLDNRFSEMLDRVQEGLAALPDMNQQFEKLLETLQKN